MNPIDVFSSAFRALKDRKLRAILTILGITIGPATIVTLLAITQGFNVGLTEQFKKMGVNTLMVMPIGSGASQRLTVDDARTIQSIENVELVLPFYRLTTTSSTGGTTAMVTITAIDVESLPNFLPGFSLLNGQSPTDYDLTGAVIGYNLAYPSDSSIAPVNVGQVITVSYTISQFGQRKTIKRSFLVKGIADRFGQGIFLNVDDGIFISFRAGQILTGSSNLAGIYVVTQGPETVNDVATAISDLKNVRTLSVEQITSTIQTIIGGVNLMLGSIAFMSVVVAFFGIMTTMFTTVTERTREIGLLKALGYTNRSVMLIFLSEAALVGLIGGIIGTTTGAALSFLVIYFLTGRSLNTPMAGAAPMARSAPMGLGGQSAFNITPIISPDLVGEAILIAMGVATLAGLIPAWRASKLTPVEALRHE